MLISPSEKVWLGESTSETTAVALDFNRDGRDDAAFCFGHLTEVSVRLQDAQGKLQPGIAQRLLQPYTVNEFTPDCHGEFLTGDLDADGRPDLVLVSQRTVTALLNRDDRFERRDRLWGTGTSGDPLLISGALVDLAGDARPELAALDNLGRLWSFSFDTQSGFANPVLADAGFLQASESMHGHVSTADFDRDGRGDLLLVGGRAQTPPTSPRDYPMYILRNEAPGRLQRGWRLDGTAYNHAIGGDVTGDALTDIVIPGLIVYPQRPDGSFGDAERYVTWPGAYAIAVADMTGDGRGDVVMNHAGWDAITTFRGSHHGFLVYHSWARGWISNMRGHPQALATGDFDGDGCVDVIATESGGYTFVRGVDCHDPHAANLNGDERIARGTWYNPHYAGQGVSIDFVDTGAGEKTLVLGWYTFAKFAPAKQQWMVAQGPSRLQLDVPTNTVFQELDLYQTNDGEGAFNGPPAVFARKVGRVRIEILEEDLLQLAWTFDSAQTRWVQAGKIRLTKLPNDHPVGPREGALRGTWWNPETSGQGVGIDVVGLKNGRDTLIGGWYTYDKATRVQSWFTLQGDLVTGAATQEVGLYLSEDGRGLGPSAQPAQIRRVGTAVLTLRAPDELDIDAHFDAGDTPGTSTTMRLRKLMPAAR